MWKSPAFVFAFAGVVLLVSLPEVPSQIRALAEALGVTGAEWHWWNYAGVLLALFLMLLVLSGVEVGNQERQNQD